VKNRTHYEETTVVNEPLNITWDGNTEGLVAAVGMPLFKVSDIVLTDEQIKSVRVTMSNGISYSGADEWKYWVDNGFVTDDVAMPEGVAFVRKDGAEHMDTMFPTAGIYAGSAGNMYIPSITTTEPIEQTKTVIKKLDKKFLPDDVGGDFVAIFKMFDVGTAFESIACDKTFEECWNAIKNGTLSAKLFRDIDAVYMQVTDISRAIYFAALLQNEARLITLRFIYDSDVDPDIWIHYFEDGTIAKGENKFPS
jgi:hypothetical protein